MVHHYTKFQVKHEIWRQLTNEYLQLTGGLVNVSQKEVMRKWTNMKFTCKAKGIPHPLLRAEHLDVNEVERKLKLCQRFVVGDEAVKRVETTKRYSIDPIGYIICSVTDYFFLKQKLKPCQE